MHPELDKLDKDKELKKLVKLDNYIVKKAINFDLV